MGAVGHRVGQLDTGHWRRRKIVGFDDHEFGFIVVLVMHQAQDPSVVLGIRGRHRSIDGLGATGAVAEIVLVALAAD